MTLPKQAQPQLLHNWRVVTFLPSQRITIRVLPVQNSAPISNRVGP